MQKRFIQVIINTVSETDAEILIAHLSNLGYEGFEETGDMLKAFINEAEFSEDALSSLLESLKFTYNTELIEPRNWNEEWEKNFEPVIVDDFVAVRADFHQPITNVEREIIITPKMSFGTGHHATTFLMMQQMRQLDFTNKTVFDFGTGTGILAILAEKLGAKSVYAIDNDEWSIANAKENVARNNCAAITLSLEDKPDINCMFDIILANINKNVILTYISELVKRLNKSGQLLVSGLLKEDEPDILQAAKQLSLNHISTRHENKWICIIFSS